MQCIEGVVQCSGWMGCGLWQSGWVIEIEFVVELQWQGIQFFFGYDLVGIKVVDFSINCKKFVMVVVIFYLQVRFGLNLFFLVMKCYMLF